jgi:hypothetical protein
MLERKFLSGRDFGMTAFKRRLIESIDMASREEVQQMKIFLLSARQ